MRIQRFPILKPFILLLFAAVMSYSCSTQLNRTEQVQEFSIGNLPDVVDFYSSPNSAIVRNAVYGSDGYIFNDNYSDTNPVWSPDGKQIAFISSRDGDNDIYVMDADGSNLINLTADPSPLLASLLYMIDKGNDAWPAWSPDGSQIVFSSARDNIMMRSVDLNLYLMETDGSSVRNLTYTGDDEGVASWSPTGKELVFAHVQGDYVNLFKITADASQVTQLTDSKFSNNYPAWSPDGRQIAFESDQDGDYEIYLMDSDGGSLIQLTDNHTEEMRPAWSPDGEQLVYLSNLDGDGEIFLMDRDGSNPVQLTQNTVMDVDPSWSPDGKQIVFESNTDEGWRIIKMDADGSNLVQLTGGVIEEPPVENASYFLQKGISLFYQYIGNNQVPFNPVIDSLTKAIELDNDFGEAYLARGMAYLYRCDFRWAHVIKTEVRLYEKNDNCPDFGLAAADLEKALEIGLAPGVEPGAASLLKVLLK